MNCPYCAEEIKDSAIVCRYCRRDLGFFQLFTSRIAALETSLADLKKNIASPVLEPPVAGPAPPPALSFSASAIFVIDTIFVAGLSAVLLSQVTNAKMVLVLVLPLPFGIYVGLRQKYTHIWSYLIAGGIQGVVNTAILAYRLTFKNLDEVSIKSSDIWYNALVFTSFAIVYGLFYTTVALFKRFLNRKRRKFNGTTLSARVAYSVIGKPAIVAGSAAEDRWKRVSEAMGALAPILTLIGSVVAAYFGYLGAIAKGAK